MSKRKLQFTTGGYYHVMNRTSSGIELFRDKKDYDFFLEKIDYYAVDCQIEIIAKCLMPTHNQILVKQDGEISTNKFIQRLSIAYSWYYRRRYGHHGSIFGGRFKAVEIADRHQMRIVCCYIHANAWKAGLTDNPLDWEAGDLSLFYSEDFWDKNPDPFLSEAFASANEFKKLFEAYLIVHQPTIIQHIKPHLIKKQAETGSP